MTSCRRLPGGCGGKAARALGLPAPAAMAAANASSASAEERRRGQWCRQLPGGCDGKAARRARLAQANGLNGDATSPTSDAPPLPSTRAAPSRRVAVLTSGLVRSWQYVREAPFYLVANAAPDGPLSVDHFLAFGVVGDPASGEEAVRVRASVARLPRNATLAALRLYNRLEYKRDARFSPAKGFPQAYGNMLAYRLMRAHEVAPAGAGGDGAPFLYDWVVRTRSDTLTRFQLVLGPPPADERVYSDKLGSCSETRAASGAEPWRCLKDLFALLTRGAVEAYYEGFYRSFGEGGGGTLCPECRLGRALRARRIGFHLLPRRIPIVRPKDLRKEAAPWSHRSLNHSSRRLGGLFWIPQPPHGAVPGTSESCPARQSSHGGVTCRSASGERLP